MRRIAAMQSAVWGQDSSWLGANLIGRIAAALHDIAVLAAEADGDVVSAAWLAFFQPGADSFARLLGGSTLPQWRGRGLYRALVAARAQRGAAQRSQTFLRCCISFPGHMASSEPRAFRSQRLPAASVNWMPTA
jgi:hypothetical protein